MSDETGLTVLEPEPTRVLTTVQDAGTLALAVMSDAEFETRLAALKRGRERIARIQRELMEKDVDYGTIPGTPKPTLYKPGAERLCDLYHYAADFAPERIVGDGETRPDLAYQTRCELHLGSLDGPVIAVGYGSANSWERKHRWRKADRLCPQCHLAGLVKTRKGRWWHPQDARPAGGCGNSFNLDDPEITEQTVGQVENPDPWDLDVTILKMSEKRSHIDATLRGCAASGLFTQDVEDLPEPPPQRAAKPARAPEPEEFEYIHLGEQSPSAGVDGGDESTVAPSAGLTSDRFLELAKDQFIPSRVIESTHKKLKLPSHEEMTPQNWFTLADALGLLREEP